MKKHTLTRGARLALLSATCVFGIVLFSFIGCQRVETEKPDVIILHTGRMRGNVYPLSMQNISPLQHYQYFAGYVKAVREEAAKSGARVFLIDLGDSLSGSFASYATGSENMIAFFNSLGYDAIQLGNLDNDIQPETLARLKAKVLCPFQAPDGKPANSAGTFTAECNGIDLIANFYGDTSAREYPERFPTWLGNTQENVEPVRDYAKIAEALSNRGRDALTLFCWLKFESPEQPPENFLKQLRDIGVDLILAHRIYSGNLREAWSERSFDNWNPPVSENILRNNGGFAVARVDLKRDGPYWRVLSHKLLPMTANTAKADPEIIARIDELSAVIEKADFPLMELPTSVDSQKILDYYLVALSQIPGTQAVAYSSNSIRADWPAGLLRASIVYNSVPWTSNLMQIQVTPEELSRIAALPEMSVFQRESSENSQEFITLTTSRFFATLFQKEFHLPAERIRELPNAGEFSYFVEFLKDNTELKSLRLSDAWKNL